MISRRKNCHNCRYGTLYTQEEYMLISCNDSSNKTTTLKAVMFPVPCMIKEQIKNEVIWSSFYCNRYKREVKK